MGDLLQERLFGQFAQRQFPGIGCLAGNPWDNPLVQERGNLAHGHALCAAKTLLALIQLHFTVQRSKKVSEFAYGLGSAQEEKAARVQGIMKQGDELLLQVAAHIDQKVAATDEVEFGEGRVFDHILLGKDQHVADAFVDAVGAALGFGREETRQPLRRDVGGDAGRIDAGPGRGNGLAVDVGGEDLQP